MKNLLLNSFKFLPARRSLGKDGGVGGYIPLIFLLLFSQTLAPIALAQSSTATPSASINPTQEVTASTTPPQPTAIPQSDDRIFTGVPTIASTLKLTKHMLTN